MEFLAYGWIREKAISKGFAFYSPLKYSELPRYLQREHQTS